jgi:hypothetical protein
MKKHEANEIAGKVLELRRRALPGAESAETRANAREEASALYGTIPTRARRYIGDWFWNAICAM